MWEVIHEIFIALAIVGFVVVIIGAVLHFGGWDWRVAKIGGAIAGVSFAMSMFAPAIGPALPFGTSSQQATAANETDMDRCQWKWGSTVMFGQTADILSDRGIIENVSVQDYRDAFRLEVGIAETVGGAPQLATYGADLDRSSCARITEFEIISRQDLPNGR